MSETTTPTLTPATFATVAELLADPTRFTKGTTARDAEGNPCPSFSTHTVAWSLLGAILRVHGGAWFRVTRQVRESVGVDVNVWADAPERTHAEVLDLCRRLKI